MDKSEVAAVLEEIAVLLELQGENPFRANAYAKAGRTIAQLETNIADLVDAGTLDQIPGIGETLRDKITTLVTTGKLPFYEDLKAKTPPGLLQMLRLPGMGPKKVKALYDQLGIDDLVKLKAGCDNGSVAKLKGFGEKTQKNILDGLAFLDQVGNRVRLDQALMIADSIIVELRKLPGIHRLEVCGSVRRRKETIRDIDILVSAEDAGPIMDAFVKLPNVQKVIGHGDTKSSVMIAGVDHHSSRVLINADLRVVSDEQFPFALNYFTGSKEHNIRLRQRAIDYGYKLNEYDLAGCKKKIKDEPDIYKALDLEYVPPELREDTGEIDAAADKKLPDLLDAKDIHGVFHNHTTWSDGAASLEQMADAARALGYRFLGIADHSQSLTVANGLSPERVRQQQKEMDAFNAKHSPLASRGKGEGVHLFKGIECDILADGSLDYDDAVLDTFDYVVASVHSYFNQTQEEMTSRIIRAIQHPRVTMLGHATGRLLLKRDAYKIDLDAVLHAAAKAGTMIEINANPYRLDLDWIHCKRAKSLGVMLVINPDAHATDELAFTRFGVDVARRGWLEKADVFNTKTLAQVVKEFERRKN
ncbi:MAG: DNA polymerase/3'-5' exonuclease PolX [Planctomycetes bacterium]|nr:DNA polymerase/3'-5' exonuclease PolX [Planctomycetota bacterium]